MAAAGVVGMSEVIQPTSAPAMTSLSGTPAMWSFIWVGAAALFLVMMHLAIAGRAGR
jgi:hypothetical protein